MPWPVHVYILIVTPLGVQDTSVGKIYEVHVQVHVHVYIGYMYTVDAICLLECKPLPSTCCSMVVYGIVSRHSTPNC